MKWIKSVADAESKENGPFFDQSGFQIAFWHKGTDGLHTTFMGENASFNDVLACLNLPQNNTTIAGNITSTQTVKTELFLTT